MRTKLGNLKIGQGMDDYISKPFNADDLFKKIDFFCEKKRV